LFPASMLGQLCAPVDGWAEYLSFSSIMAMPCEAFWAGGRQIVAEPAS
jgi:hypothetical protein